MNHDTQNNTENQCTDLHSINLGSSSARRVSAFHKVPAVTGESGLYEYFHMENGFILLHRSLRDHWISQDPSTLSVFVQILLRVEWKSGKSVFVGNQEVKLRAGEMTFGRHQMSKWANLSEQNVRTAITKLKSTMTVTIKVTNKFSILYLNNWQKYQSSPSNQPASQPTANQRLTTLEQYNNKISIFTPPTLEEVKAYFKESNIPLDAVAFFNHYDSANWFRGKTKIKKWKSCVQTWLSNQNKFGGKNVVDHQERQRPLISARDAIRISGEHKEQV